MPSKLWTKTFQNQNINWKIVYRNTFTQSFYQKMKFEEEKNMNYLGIFSHLHQMKQKDWMKRK